MPPVEDAVLCRCGDVLGERAVLITLPVHGEEVQLSDVPQLSCPTCGAQYFRVPVLMVAEAAYRDEPVRLG